MANLKGTTWVFNEIIDKTPLPYISKTTTYSNTLATYIGWREYNYTVVRNHYYEADSRFTWRWTSESSYTDIHVSVSSGIFWREEYNDWYYPASVETEEDKIKCRTVTFVDEPDVIAEGTEAFQPTPISLDKNAFETWLNRNARQIGPEPTPQCSVNLTVNPSGAGSVSGGGMKDVGSQITITATPLLGSKYVFKNWALERTGQVLATTSSYTFTVPPEQDYNLVANFEFEGYKPSVNPSELPSDTILDTKASGWLTHGDTGMYCIFTPTSQQLEDIANWLYNANINTDIQKGVYEANIGDILLGFYIMPFTINTTKSKPMKITSLYAVQWQTSNPYQTTVNINYTEDNIYTMNCGSISVPGIYNGALDYQTNVDIYLPFIGYQSLETYDVIGHTLNPIYQIDLLTGDCICKIFIDGSCKYQFNGTCGYSIPITQQSNANVVMKTISSAVGLLSAVGGFSGSISETTRAGKLNYSRTTGAMTSYKSTRTTTQQGSPMTRVKEGIGSLANMGGGKSHGGALQGNVGYLSIGKPYLTIVRPRLDIPANFGKVNGYPCNKWLNLGNLHGFTKVDEIILTGFDCTEQELNEIESLLTEGVIL